MRLQLTRAATNMAFCEHVKLTASHRNYGDKVVVKDANALFPAREEDLPSFGHVDSNTLQVARSLPSADSVEILKFHTESRAVAFLRTWRWNAYLGSF